MNNIDVEQQRLQLQYQTYLRTIIHTEAFVSCLQKTVFT
jgi:hypothetical protein